MYWRVLLNIGVHKTGFLQEAKNLIDWGKCSGEKQKQIKEDRRMKKLLTTEKTFITSFSLHYLETYWIY